MKKIFAILLVVIICLSLVGCGTPAPDNGTSAEKAQEFYSLMVGKWEDTEGDLEVTFYNDKTMLFVVKLSGNSYTYTWDFTRYMDSMREYTLAIQDNPDFSEDYGVYLGREITRMADMLVGYNDDGTVKMYYYGKFWNKVEGDIPNLKPTSTPSSTPAATPTPTPTPAPTPTPDPKKEAFMALMPKMYGEWLVLDRDEVEIAEKFTINEDGSFIYGDRNLTWEYQSYIENSVMAMNIYEGDTKIGTLDIYLNIKNGFEARLRLDSLESGVEYYNPSHYELVDLTVDNIMDYFELKEEMFWVEDAFGDVERCYYRIELVLKEQYKANLSKLLMDDIFDDNVIENGAVDIAYDSGLIWVEISLADRQYSFGDFVKNGEGSSVQTMEYSTSDESLYISCTTINIADWEVEDNEIGFRKNFRPIRVKGQIAFFIQ